jgi:hypothetical protein
MKQIKTKSTQKIDTLMVAFNICLLTLLTLATINNGYRIGSIEKDRVLPTAHITNEVASSVRGFEERCIGYEIAHEYRPILQEGDVIDYCDYHCNYKKDYFNQTYFDQCEGQCANFYSHPSKDECKGECADRCFKICTETLPKLPFVDIRNETQCVNVTLVKTLK